MTTVVAFVTLSAWCVLVSRYRIYYIVRFFLCITLPRLKRGKKTKKMNLRDVPTERLFLAREMITRLVRAHRLVRDLENPRFRKFELVDVDIASC